MWSDRETDQDCLGFVSYVSTLSEICMRKGLAPLTLGVFGSWGSGKSSLMKMLQCHIENSRDERDIKTLWFNAWRYEGKEETQSALIHSIINKLSEDKKLADQAKDLIDRMKENVSVLKLAKFIGKTAVTLSPDISGFIDCFREQSEKLVEKMESFEKDFAKLLETMKVERLVVFIDDLDRCQSEKVMEVFETIKLFLEVPECAFVVGADVAKIEQAIIDTYADRTQASDQLARDYLEKIIQIPFGIPEQQIFDIACYVGMLILHQYLSPDGYHLLLSKRSELRAAAGGIQSEFKKWVTENSGYFGSKTKAVLEDIDNIMPHTNILARGLRGNPRQIKRFLNILGLRRSLAQANNLSIDLQLLIKVLVIEYTWREFFQAVIETTDPQTGKSSLIDEVVKSVVNEGVEKEPDSDTLTAALESPGLSDFLAEKPTLSGVDLTPYLFLAQTSLEGRTTVALTLPDLERDRMVELIKTADRVRSQAGARAAARTRDSMASAVVRALIPDMLSATDVRIQTNIVTSLDTICHEHPLNYDRVIKALTQLDPRKKEPVAIAASTLLTNAETRHFDVPPDLRRKFTDASPLAAALTSKKKAK